MKDMLKRELHVAFSKRAQPPAFRIIKWIVIVVLVTLFHRHRYFWRGAGVLFLAALALHLFYRRKTQCWTRPWGGWNDLDARKGVELNIEHSTFNVQHPKPDHFEPPTER